MLKKINFLFIAFISITAGTMLPNGDESLIQSTAIGKELPSSVEGLWEVPTALNDPEQVEMSEHLLAFKTKLTQARQVKLEELFDRKSLDILITIPTAFGNPSNNHISDFLERYYELRKLGVNNICILSQNTADVLAAWKMLLFAAHKREHLTCPNAEQYITDPQYFFKERFSKLRFISMSRLPNGDINPLCQFLRIEEYNQSGLGDMCRRSAAIIHQGKITYQAIQNDEQCTQSTSVNAVIKRLASSNL